MTAIGQMVEQILLSNKNGAELKSVSEANYLKWQKFYTWDALVDQRYGQSFCNRFGLHDNHLFYNTGGVEWADRYIKETYID
jgi:hypothetical protein